MLKKNCASCGKRIERKFRFCPWCGKTSRKTDVEDYGMLGFDDEIKSAESINPLSMFDRSFGNVFSQLTKQISRELQNLNLEDKGKPNGIEIRFSTNNPMQRITKPSAKNPISVSEEPINEEEKDRRKKLPIEPAESKIRRLPEGIIYEIETPGVISKQDVSIIRLEDGIEVRAYSKNKCYIKTIAIRANILKYLVKDNKVFIQLGS